MLPVIFIEI